MVVPYVARTNDPLTQHINELDHEMNKILADKKLSTSQKVLLYNRVLYQYNAQLDRQKLSNNSSNNNEILTNEITSQMYSKIKPELDDLKQSQYKNEPQSQLALNNLYKIEQMSNKLDQILENRSNTEHMVHDVSITPQNQFEIFQQQQQNQEQPESFLDQRQSQNQIEQDLKNSADDSEDAEEEETDQENLQTQQQPNNQQQIYQDEQELYFDNEKEINFLFSVVKDGDKNWIVPKGLGRDNVKTYKDLMPNGIDIDSFVDFMRESGIQKLKQDVKKPIIQSDGKTVRPRGGQQQQLRNSIFLEMIQKYKIQSAKGIKRPLLKFKNFF